jgi:hypothetical protein
MALSWAIMFGALHGHLTQQNGQGLDHSIVHVPLIRAFPVVVLRMWPFMVKTESRKIKICLFGSPK